MGGFTGSGGLLASGGKTGTDGGAGGTSMGMDGGVGGKTSSDGSMGGSTSAGGSTGAGGGTVVASACGLPDGPNSAVAEPTGSGSTLTVLPWAGFKAAVTFSFDDANSSQTDNYATMNGMGIPMTFYLITSNATSAVWKQALKDGHEIGNHTQNHSCGTTAQGESDIKSMFGVTAYTMAAPNGDTACEAQAQSNNIFINRGVGDGIISFTADDSSLAYNLNTNIPPAGAAASSLTGKIDSAYSAGGWQTFCIHGFTGGSDGAYQAIPLTSLTDAVKTEKAKKDLWIDTMVAVGSYWRGARAFAKATSATSGTDKTWTWTLPKGFPPNKCLRVKSDGGVVKQKNSTISWNSHGYYEISLDAGEVTLSAQ
jgi:peptidoglycan/xylan/chitin deacetylase (PgdA/CDA1 family)